MRREPVHDGFCFPFTLRGSHPHTYLIEGANARERLALGGRKGRDDCADGAHEKGFVVGGDVARPRWVRRAEGCASLRPS